MGVERHAIAKVVGRAHRRHDRDAATTDTTRKDRWTTGSVSPTPDHPERKATSNASQTRLDAEMSLGLDAFLLGDVFDDCNEFVDAVAVVAGEGDELPRALDDRATFRCARDQDATPAAELE